MPDNTLSTLAQIRTKVRRLTRSPSTNQLSDSELDAYVNTFVLYDFPEQLRLKYLRKTFTFFTQPNIDNYASNAVVGDPFNNFDNAIVSIHPPVYVDGNLATLTQSREQFYNLFPLVNSVIQIDTGDGVTTNFVGTLSQIPVLPSNVTFTSIDANNNGLRISDNGAGALVGDIGGGANTINYVTGAYNFTFNVAPAADTAINVHAISYQASRPTTVLFYENQFWLRPVPDQVYRVECDAFTRPTELLAAATPPDLAQWWQYIAGMAAKKIFEDRMDMNSIQQLMPFIKEQERLVLRKTIVQQSNERSATIYADNVGLLGDSWKNYY